MTSASTPMRERRTQKRSNRSARACSDISAGSAADIARGLAVRHDHGSQYMSDHFQKEIAFLGIESSPAFVRAPERNGCAERFIRTLKENLLWVRHFQKRSRNCVRRCSRSGETYNTTWLIERHGYHTPEQFRHHQQLQQVAAAASGSIRCPRSRGAGNL